MLMSTRPISDVRGGRDYRTAMLPVLARRAWQTARLRLSEPATGEFATSEPPTGDPATRDPATREPANREPANRDPANRDPATPRPVRVNARDYPVSAPAHQTLLDLLRDSLRLTGTKECCAEGECGACTVMVDGEAVCSCLVMAAETAGHEITTIEALASGGRLDPLQAAFIESGAVQCGFCIPGMIMSARALLDLNPRPTREDVQDALSGNLCRCGGYSRIVDAVLTSSVVER
jgi:carbon-monoxide dehydrogenase small subunit